MHAPYRNTGLVMLLFLAIWDVVAVGRSEDASASVPVRLTRPSRFTTSYSSASDRKRKMIKTLGLAGAIVLATPLFRNRDDCQELGR